MKKTKEIKVGSVVMLDDKFKCKVLDMSEYDGIIYYYVSPIEFNAITREVENNRLKLIEA